jgi:PAS domain-containing protein
MGPSTIDANFASAKSWSRRMLLNPETIDHILESAVTAASSDPESLVDYLDRIPAAIYVTDKDGTITHFNRACIELAGRTPAVGKDKWCVTWKLYNLDGEHLPHNQCPMAIAIREKRSIRDVEAVAERPDGTRVTFVPYPTPMFDAEGNLTGAVNLLMEVSRKHQPLYLREQADRCRRLAREVSDKTVKETLILMAAKYDEQALKLARAPAVERSAVDPVEMRPRAL